MTTIHAEDYSVLTGIFFSDSYRIVHLGSTPDTGWELESDPVRAIGIHTGGDLAAHLHSGELSGIISFASKATLPGFQIRTYNYINNPDGSIRWLYPATSHKPVFLNLYNSSGWRGWLFRTVFKTGFSLGAGSHLKSGTVHIYYKKEELLDTLLAQTPHDEYAIFTGTVGDNRKAVIALAGKGKKQWFYKLPLSRNAGKLVRQEAKMLHYLNLMDFEKICFPEAKRLGPGVLLSDVRPEKYANSFTLQPVHFAALWEMYEQTYELQRLGDMPSFAAIDQCLNEIDSVPVSNDLPIDTIRRLADGLYNLRESLDPDALVPTVIAHGDFTPWNMYTGKAKLHVYDWELSERLPLLYDAIHFVFQSGILVKRLPFDQIMKQVEALQHHPDVRDMLEGKSVEFHWTCRFYLLRNVSYYLAKYIRQEPLHEQAHWLVNTWVAAVRTCNQFAEVV